MRGKFLGANVPKQTITGTATGTPPNKRFNEQGPVSRKNPGNLTGPKSYFEIKVSRKVGCILTSNEVYFVSLAENFTVRLSNLLKLPS